MANLPNEWVVVGEVAGSIQAEILRGLLEAQEISVQLGQEGAGRAYGLELGPLGTVRILVPAEEQAAAEAVLDNYQAGRYESQTDDPDSSNSGEGLL
jgi:ABC-type arginine transport system permease subunit